MPPPRIAFLSRRAARLALYGTQRPDPQLHRQFHATPRSAEQANQRYGTANEPPPHLHSTSKDASKQAKSATAPEEALSPQKTPPAHPPPESQPIDLQQGDDAIELPQESQSDTPNTPLTAADASSALSSILSMQPPMSDNASEEHPPHLQTPPYVHHFDTYSFVKSLQSEATFSENQSIITMKAIRALLLQNMDLARDGIVSRGDAEMDAYQFKAASGELRTEMRQRRAAADEKYRADRVQLQHELDSLAQRITQESLNLKDELKGMFDDRKMAVRVERRNTDNRIHELGYRITTVLNSGMRNEIETLRFVLTRRTVLTLTAVVIMSLAALRLATYSNKKEERKEKDKDKQQRDPKDPEKTSTPTNSLDPYEGAGDMTSADIARRVQNGENPAYSSLG